VRTRLAVSLLVLVFAPGCVPTPEPVGDIDTAKPDERLIGTWTLSSDTLVFDRSPVKGHPKGVLRMRQWDSGKGAAKDTPDWWVFTAEVDEHAYSNWLVEADKKGVTPELGTEGAYEKWTKKPTKGYIVSLLTFGRDTFALEGGDLMPFEALMTKEKFEKRGDFHALPAGWLTKYLEKNGPDALFPGKYVVKFTRAKAK